MVRRPYGCKPVRSSAASVLFKRQILKIYLVYALINPEKF
ncbi:K(+)-transporting ATPase subunit F [Clostridioides difficile]|nr:K(+)-transporting ATPase subunit F [Clostridioides difficile]